MAHRAHVADVDADLVPQVLDRHVGHIVRVVGRRLDGEGVDALCHHRGKQARGDRGAHQAQLPGDQLAALVEGADRGVEGRRPVNVVGRVVFPRPQELHGLADRLGGFDRGGDEVDIQAAAEAAAEERGVHAHLLGLEPGGARGGLLRHLLDLRRHVDVAALGAHVGGAVLRLERRVRQERQLVLGLDHPRCGLDGGVGVPVPAGALRRAGRALEPAQDHAVVQGAVRTVVPLDREHIARLERLPPRGGDHRDARRGLHHGLDTGQGARLAVIEARRLAAERRRLGERGIEHLGQAHVDAVARTAVHLEWGIESPHGGADQAEVPGIGEFDVVRHREPGGGLGARAEARALAGRGDHEAVLHAADGGPNAPLPRGGADQHGARLRARPAELQPRIAHAGAAAGDLRAEEVVLVRIARRSEVDADAAEVHSELFGDERRQRRVDALAHLRAVAEEGDGVVGADAQPRIGGDRLRLPARAPRLAAAGQVQRDDQATRDTGGALEEGASIEAHAEPPDLSCAAR